MITEPAARTNNYGGFAAAFFFLLQGVLFLQVLPGYFWSPDVTRYIALGSLFIGLMTLSSKLLAQDSNPEEPNLDNPGFALLVALGWGLLYANFSSWWVNLLLYPLLIAAAAPAISGFVRSFGSAFRPGLETHQRLGRLGLALLLTGAFGYTGWRLLLEFGVSV